MKPFHALAALGAAAVLAHQPAWAGPGHDHGEAAPATTGQALPRFTAESEAFELVGVLQGRQLTLYLDRFADNSPVRGAQIELEIAGAKFKAEASSAHADDSTYEVVLPEAPKPGLLSVTATVLVGNEADLLAGDIDLQETASASSAHPAHGGFADAAHAAFDAYARHAAWGAAGVALVGLLAWGARRKTGARRVRAGGAA